MFDFLGRSRPKTKKQAPAAHPPPPHSGQMSANQREMVRLTLHNVLKHHGIPGNWIACEVAPIPAPNHSDALLIQLVVLHWHDALMRYALTLQQAVLAGLKRFDASADASKYQFSWKFSPDCGGPATPLPESSFWSTPTPNTAHSPPAPTVNAATIPKPSMAAAAAPAPSKPKFDLPPTAADLRDDDDDHGFASTQINDMH